MNTLLSRGPVLPIGISDGSGNLIKDIEFKRWTGATMRELGKLRETERELSMPEHVGLILSVLATRIGPYDFATLKRDKQKLVVSQMYMGDVFYAYCWARLQSLGPDINMKLSCPICRESFNWIGDLGTVSVTSVESLEKANWRYELSEPVKIRGNEAKALSLGPAKWYTLESAQVAGQLDLEGGKLAIVAGSIRGVEGREGFPLTQSEIDELSGIDIEGIIAEMDEHYIGLDMRVEAQCPRNGCKKTFTSPIDWSYGSFFGASSRSRVSKPSTT